MKQGASHKKDATTVTLVRKLYGLLIILIREYTWKLWECRKKWPTPLL